MSESYLWAPSSEISGERHISIQGAVVVLGVFWLIPEVGEPDSCGQQMGVLRSSGRVEWGSDNYPSFLPSSPVPPDRPVWLVG